MLVRLKAREQAMASRWRRRRPCLIYDEVVHSAALIEVSGRGALIETGANLTIATEVTLSHPDAGEIRGVVDAITVRGVQLAFHMSEASVAFAVAAIASDMSDPVY